MSHLILAHIRVGGTCCPGEYSLRRQPTFHDVTSDFPAKWCLRNDCRYSLLMTCHYPDLFSASHWSCQEGKFASTNQKHYPDLGSDALSVDVISWGNQRWRHCKIVGCCLSCRERSPKYDFCCWLCGSHLITVALLQYFILYDHTQILLFCTQPTGKTCL